MSFFLSDADGGLYLVFSVHSYKHTHTQPLTKCITIYKTLIHRKCVCMKGKRERKFNDDPFLKGLNTKTFGTVYVLCFLFQYSRGG